MPAPTSAVPVASPPRRPPPPVPATPAAPPRTSPPPPGLMIGVFAVLPFGPRVAAPWVPPHWWYLSRRKRRAMSLALKAYAERRPQCPAAWGGSRVYRTDREKCFVFVSHYGPDLQPPSYDVYAVFHDDGRVEPLGCWQFHWGILPRHIIERYETSRRADQSHQHERPTRRRTDGQQASEGVRAGDHERDPVR
jgi:hypothetical protein